MALDFPSTSLNSGQIYEGWVWTGSAWLFSGRAVGGTTITTTAAPTTTTTTAAPTTTTTTAAPTTTTTTTASLIPVVELTALTQSNAATLVSATGTLISGSGITERGIISTNSPTPPAYGASYIPADAATNPFTTSNIGTNWAAPTYYIAYAINSYGTGYSDSFIWAHNQSFMISASRSGSTIDCSCENRAGASANLNPIITEIGFLWNNTQSTFPTFESGALGYSVAGSQLPTSPTNMTGTITGVSNGTGYNVRGYIKYSSGFYWYTLSTTWVAPV